MSSGARDLLMRGRSAALANSREEAKFFLEWVLRTDSDIEQRTEAWYWLSYITDDPVEKRSCLEQVLAAMPTHPEARRDLAILQGRLKQSDIVDHRNPVQPLVPSATLRPEDVQRSPCPTCGAKLVYNAYKGSMACQFCGYSPVDGTSDVARAGGVQEQDWIAAIYTKRGHRWEVPTQRTLHCDGCGATVTVAPAHISTECPFCSSPHIVVSEESRELIQPDGIVPFAFDESAALVHARRWVDAERFRPEDLDERATFTMPRPVYIPFWTYDISGDVQWSVLVPRSRYNKHELVRETGTHSVLYDDLMVPGTGTLPAALLSQVEYDLSALVPYSPALLADWPAEIYTISVADASLSAHEKVSARAKEDVLAGLSGEVRQELRMERVNITVDSYKLVLLPLWVTEYGYKSRQFEVLVNGQSGAAYGEVPRNMVMQFLDDVLPG